MDKWRTIQRFTLIELLVVVSVIAILAAMLLPALVQARRTALRTLCMNNMRNWGQMLHLYADDYDDTFIWAGNRNRGMWNFGKDERANQELMEDYGMELKLAFCPDSCLTDEAKAYRYDDPTHGMVIGYGYYPFKNPDGDEAHPPSGTKATENSDGYGRDLILLADFNEIKTNGVPHATNHESPSSPAFAGYTTQWTDGTIRLPSGGNILYFDSHVSWIPNSNLDKTVYLRTAGAWDSFYWE